MFQDLDSTVEAILDNIDAPQQLRNADVSFETPDKGYKPSQATVNLFLYEVKENRELRDPEPVFDLINGRYQRQQPPLRIDCSYLVTAWSEKTGGEKVVEEHRLLGQALAWLARFDTIPASFRQGELDNDAFPAPPTMVAQMDGKQSISEFWSALGLSPRPAFTLIVTLSLTYSETYPVGPEVITHEIGLGEKVADTALNLERVYAIGGTVHNSATKTAVSNATITIQELNWMAETDENGRFRFAKLEAGTYTLQARATNFSQVDKSVAVPGTASDAYDIELSPV